MSTRTRIIEAALELFLSKGTSDTTTKEIAELAQVNEVTIFRHFKSKYGLLLAVLETQISSNLVANLVESIPNSSNLADFIEKYAHNFLDCLEQYPQLICSIIGEAQQYPPENRLALGKGIGEANLYLAKPLQEIIEQQGLNLSLTPVQLAGLLHTMLLGYGVIEFMSESHQLWQNRSEFLGNLVNMYSPPTVSPPIRDLPPQIVHSLMQKAKKHSKQAYALVYVLFGAGLTAQEVINLERSHHICYPQGQLLEITRGYTRQVPLNQSILGKRYGSYLRNPLTQWLKSRQDHYPALFINPQGESLSLLDISQQWQELVTDLPNLEGDGPTLEQAQQTWCVEMLTRGISLENLQLLIGWDLAKLQPYAHRAKEKAALAQAFLLDQS